MGLGLYQLTTTNMKKVGGPVVYHLLVAGAGAATFLLADYGIRAIKKHIKTNKYNRETKLLKKFDSFGEVNRYELMDNKTNEEIMLFLNKRMAIVKKSIKKDNITFATIEFFKKIK